MGVLALFCLIHHYWAASPKRKVFWLHQPATDCSAHEAHSSRSSSLPALFCYLHLLQIICSSCRFKFIIAKFTADADSSINLKTSHTHISPSEVWTQKDSGFI